MEFGRWNLDGGGRGLKMQYVSPVYSKDSTATLLGVSYRCLLGFESFICWLLQVISIAKGLSSLSNSLTQMTENTHTEMYITEVQPAAAAAVT